MAPQAILEEVRRSPFEPFKLVLADGARYDIQHPDQCMVMKKSVMIGFRSSSESALRPLALDVPSRTSITAL